MTDAVITEHEGSRQGLIVRYYQYGNGGVRVLDAKKALRRMYRFDPSSDMMTECDPARPDRILRRFVFDRYGMLEETFAFGHSPRTFRYEAGGERIAVREGGDYGAVGKLFTFEGNGVSETGWGRNGEIERVFVFEPGNATITERTGGWVGDIERTITFEGIGASLFLDPEAFLQFVIFTEWSEEDRAGHIDEQVAQIRGGKPASSPASPFAYAGKRSTAPGGGGARAREPAARTPVQPAGAKRTRASGDDPGKGGLDFIPSADAPVQAAPRGPPSQRSAEIPFEERRQQRDRVAQERYTSVRSDEIALQDRFERARSERGELSKGKSVEIPIQDRFEYARQAREPLSKGKSVEIPLEERFSEAHADREPLSRGKSVDIPIEERFERARQDRGQLSRGKSVEIPLEERFGGAPRYERPPAREKSVEVPPEDRVEDTPRESRTLTRSGSIGASSRKRKGSREL